MSVAEKGVLCAPSDLLLLEGPIQCILSTHFSALFSMESTK